MYTTEASQTTGHRRLLQHQHSKAPAPCPCQHCIHYEQMYDYRRGSGYPPASARQTDHPPPDRRRDIQAPRAQDVGGRASAVDRAQTNGHLSPQRRPVFSGLGPRSQSDDWSQACPCEQWNCPLELGARQYPSVKEQCGCVAHSGTVVHSLHPGIPHPLPHLQVKGQGYRRRMTVRYIATDEEEDCGYTRVDPHTYTANGHSGARRVFFEEGEPRDNHQDSGRPKGGSEESFNSCGSHKGFFPTEVPQRHLSKTRRKGSYVLSSDSTSLESSRPAADRDHQRQAVGGTTQKRRQDSVRDQIRQVVTDLEDVLGGLKQVHVEMKEVVEQIDRLTANIDLREEASRVARGSSKSLHESTHSGDFRVPPLANHKPASAQALQGVAEDRVILRTNSPSPVHMASVVKTNCFTPTSLNKDVGVNGHPPHLYPARDCNHVSQEHRPQTAEPKDITGSSAPNPRTQKPPPYPQNGRCGKGPYPPPKPVRTPANLTRGLQNTSMV